MENLRSTKDSKEDIKKNQLENCYTLLESINKICDSMKAFVEFWDVTEEKHDNIKIFNSKLINFKYPPAYREVYQYIKDSSEEDVSKIEEQDIEKLFIEAYNDEKVMELLSEWKANDKIKDRHHILEEIVSAHINKMYYVSIATMDTQIEAILAIYSQKKRTPGFKEFINIKLLEVDNKSLQNKIVSLTPFIEETYFDGFTWGNKYIPELSRHSILHGASTMYGTKVNSIKMIATIDCLINLVTIKDMLESDG